MARLDRGTRRVPPAGREPDGRGWVSHGLAALGISALGLAVAGSVALTTNAQTIGPERGRSAGTVAAPTVVVTDPVPSESPAVRSFSSAATAPYGLSGADGTAPAVRTAIINEVAAQRAEELAKSAEDATTLALSATRSARQQDLESASQASRAAATALIQENVRRAAAARAAAARAAAAATQQRETAVESGETTIPDTTVVPSGGGGAAPVPGAVIGAHFGQRGMWSSYHTGLDFRASYGTPIRAVKSGVVLYAGNSGDWAGNHVAVKHADGRTTMYSHMSSMAARAGQLVKAGQVIGYVGQTGRAFGAHLHFELYPVGVKYGDVYKAINPQPWLTANGVRTR